MKCHDCAVREMFDGLGITKACPALLAPHPDLVETNVATGEARFIEGCAIEVFPRLLMHSVVAGNRAAASGEAARNAAQETFGRVALEFLRLGQAGGVEIPSPRFISGSRIDDISGKDAAECDRGTDPQCP